VGNASHVDCRIYHDPALQLLAAQSIGQGLPLGFAQKFAATGNRLAVAHKARLFCLQR
jgi:hypothetical protein